MNRQTLRVLPYVAVLLPFDLLVTFGLLVAEVVRRFRISNFGFRQGNTSGEADPEIRNLSLPSATIIIVNWDGKHLLEGSLPRTVEAAAGKADVLVVDNGSRDGSVDFVRRQFPAVRLLTLDRNYGFTGGNNRGVAAVETDIVVFLNNDMVVDRGFLKPLLEGFSDPSIFAVTSQIFFEDDLRSRDETGNTRSDFERGFFYPAHAPIESCDATPVFWAGGGSSAVDRRKFLALGGFDSLYHPFYVEDMDLSYQAWKRGWKCVLMPASHVVHKHRGTSRPKFGNRFVDNTIRRNQYLFIWKNVTDLSMIFEHLLNLPRIHGRAMREHGVSFEFEAFLRAVSQLPHALWKRISNLAGHVLSDREVLARSRKS